MKEINSKRKDILRAAAKIFGEKGLDSASMDEVAAKAAVAKGTIFYHFSSKDKLFSALIEEGVEVLVEQVSVIVAQKKNVVEKLEDIINCHFSFFKANRGVCLMILGQLGSFQKRWYHSVELIQSRYIPVLKDLIEEGKREGAIDVGLNTEAIIVNLFSLLAMSGVDWAIFHSKVAEGEIINLTKKMVINGLKK